MRTCIYIYIYNSQPSILRAAACIYIYCLLFPYMLYAYIILYICMLVDSLSIGEAKTKGIKDRRNQGREARNQGEKTWAPSLSAGEDADAAADTEERMPSEECRAWLMKAFACRFCVACMWSVMSTRNTSVCCPSGMCE